ncbi:MAG: hypothetical protein GY708_21760 [Actinomycetia bacterium]|nr:hypothetical protein [Actinomycetes bacterium]MCP4958623.1 hypothetical protein [Actinomycetes bacterium]
MPHPELEYAISPAAIDDVDGAPADDLAERSKRLRCVEGQMSYLRRVAQSRIDVARSELSERAAGRQSSDLSDIIRRLPDVLAERGVSSSQAGVVAPDIEIDPGYAEDLDSVVSPVRMLEIGSISRTELRELVVRLEAEEARISVQRRLVQKRLDQIDEEIARRQDVAV